MDMERYAKRQLVHTRQNSKLGRLFDLILSFLAGMCEREGESASGWVVVGKEGERREGNGHTDRVRTERKCEKSLEHGT
jgi:hypothetical protein